MRILVTGATGFIGSAFTRLATAAGHEVAGLVQFPEESLRGSGSEGRLVRINGTLEDAPWKEIEAFQPDTLVHLAWILTPGVYLESEQNDDFVDWSMEFVRRARQAGVQHVFGAGTCIEYEIGEKPLSETETPLKPISRYARSKNLLRVRLEEAARDDGYTLTWGRVFYPYGPGEDPARLCSSIIDKLSRDEKIVLKTPGSTKDWIHIDDLASAMLLSLEMRAGGAINFGTGVGTTVREIADTIARIMEKPGLVENAAEVVPDPLGCVIADPSRLRQLGWSPGVSLEEGLRQLHESLMSVS